MVDRIIPRRRENMRFRVRTIMVAVVIVGLVMALTVLWWRAAEEVRSAHAEMQATRLANDEIRMALAVAEARALSAEKRAIAAEARADLLKLQAKAIQDVDVDQDTSQKPRTRPSAAAQ
jgi:type II secretory pathway pseudopilin PulG